MANKKVVIADAGPLIAFGRINSLHMLVQLFEKIIVPVSVLNECIHNIAQAGAKEISIAVNKKLIQLHDNPDKNHPYYNDLSNGLGAGEASAIILASQLKVGLLIDDKLGRKAAQKMQIPIIGTAGILLLAKEKKLIQKIAPLIFELRKSGYYLSEELIKTILIRAEEMP